MNGYKSKNYTNAPTFKKEAVSGEHVFAFLCIAISIVLFSALPAYRILDKNYKEESGLGTAVKKINMSISQNDDISAFLGLGDNEKTETEEAEFFEYKRMTEEEREEAVQKYINEHTPKTVFPLDGDITSPFSYRVDPFYDEAEESGNYEFHTGIDISAAKSTEIMAFTDGIVKKVIYSNIGYGNHILVSHSGGVETLYAHCADIFVSEGDKVKTGDIIAVAGSTGRSTGTHLHFEIRIDGKAVDPVAYIKEAEAVYG